MECKSYIEIEDIPGKKEMFVFGFKQIKTDKNDNFILIGCESNRLYENDKLINFRSNKVIKKEIQQRGFKISGWSFMTLVKKSIFFQNSEHMFIVGIHQPKQEGVLCFENPNDCIIRQYVAC